MPPDLLWNEIHGWFDYDGVYRGAVIEAEDGDCFVEVGCWLGKSTAFLAGEIQKSGKQIALYAVDTWKGTPSSDDVQMKEYLELYQGDVFGPWLKNMQSCGVLEVLIPLRMPSVLAALFFPDESVDFCFLDADHAYEAVKADLEAWLPKVRKGGVIAGHDYRMAEFPGVTQAVHEVLGERHVQERRERCWWHRKGGAA